MKFLLIVFAGTTALLSILLLHQHARLRTPDFVRSLGRRTTSSNHAVGGPKLPASSAPLSLDGQIRGSTSARVALVEFGDFDCPFCAKFARDTLPAVDSEFVDRGEVLFVFKHTPMHPLSRGAAIVADCAGGQGRFWQMHDSLFRGVDTLDDAGLTRQASALRLNLEQLAVCKAAGSAAGIDAQIREARQFGVQGTPTLMFGRLQRNNLMTVTTMVAGAMPLALVRSELLKLLGAPQE
jgi:protein-disulfide isomerase